MCEQIIKYDCGHLSRKKITCRKHKRQSCFSSPSECTEDKKLDKRSKLCPACAGKDREVYINGTPSQPGVKGPAVMDQGEKARAKRTPSALSPRARLIQSHKRMGSADSTMQKLRREIKAGLNLDSDSDESMVCATARNMEKRKK